MSVTLEVFQALRQALPLTVTVRVRISAPDWVDGGWDEAQSVALGQALKAAGCDYIHVSSGDLSPQRCYRVGPRWVIQSALGLACGRRTWHAGTGAEAILAR